MMKTPKPAKKSKKPRREVTVSVPERTYEMFAKTVCAFSRSMACRYGVVSANFQAMSTLAEIEAAIPQLSPEELSELESAVRAVRRRKQKASGRSALDLAPLQLGKVLRPLGPDDDLLGEMLDDTRF